MSGKRKILLVFGTRPEAIKLAPVILELKKNEDIFETRIAITGQHRELLDQILSGFGITPDHDLNLMMANQTLDHILTKAHLGIGALLDAHAPDLVLVHGDTTTSMAASLSAHHHQIKLGHIEAGLRSFDKYNPFPEEINRTITDSIADFCFAPTEVSRANLLKGGVHEDNIFVTGNTVVDALLAITKEEYAFENPVLQEIDFINNKVILLTTHRRENYLSGDMKNIMDSMNFLVETYPDVHFVFPVHLNPNVRKVVDAELKPSKQIHLVEPLSYKDLVKVMKHCYLILTDSGGIQEEGPTFGKPVLVLRKVTERPEGITSGVAKLVGTDRKRIIDEVVSLFDKENYLKMAKAVNPYGDGRAAEKIIQVIKEKL